MKLIDADKLNADIESAQRAVEDSDTILGANAIKGIIEDQPEVWAMFSGRCAGKKAFSEYVALCKLLDYYGVDSTKPVESFKFLLEAYAKVIIECTGSQMTKLTYTPEAVIACICDRQTELTKAETVPQAMWFDKTVDGEPAPWHCTNCGGRPFVEDVVKEDKFDHKVVFADYCHHCGAEMLKGEKSANG